MLNEWTVGGESGEVATDGREDRLPHGLDDANMIALLSKLGRYLLVYIRTNTRKTRVRGRLEAGQ
jgi:hypothetical protein